MDLNPRFRFDSFVVGASNRVAAEAARTVAEAPGAAYNPLLIYGRSGLGKTHLLQAIGFQVQERAADLRLEYLTFEAFVERYHASLAAGQLEPFRVSMLETGLLLLDDLQFVLEHPEAQAELLWLSEALLGAGRQMVVACDRAPAAIAGLDERLISRLAGGLVVDVTAPDLATRVAILERKVAERGAGISRPVLETVAELTATNVRDLVGAVNRLIAFQAVSETPLTSETARALLAGEMPGPAPGGAAGPDAAAPPAPAGVATAAAGGEPDEFAAFLSAVSTTVAETVDAWRGQVGAAVLRWQGEGYRTRPLEQLLLAEEIPDVAGALAAYGAAVEELRRLAAEVAAFDPAASGHACLRDPEHLEEARAFAERVRAGVEPPPAPARGLTLADYVRGTANDAAVRAVEAVVAAPGAAYDPLFLTGASGTGKTHLLHAAGNALLAAHPGLVVACLSTQVFVEELAQTLAAGRIEWWRSRYRHADALLLDDLQLLAGREQAEQELFALVDAFAAARKQLVLTADQPPGQLAALSARLKTRCEAGLVLELTAPDRPMRAELVRRLLAARDVAAVPDAVEYLAGRPADSARAVQGLVNRALARMDPATETLTAATARLAVEGRAPRPSQAQAISAPRAAGLDPLLSSREKVVWDWPDIAECLVEEWR